MKQNHVPSCGPRYWVALSLASILGCNTGDAFASVFGFIGGSPLLLAGFALILVLERRDPRPSQAYYWLAIVVVRTAATNFADFAIHGIGMGPALALLTGLLVATLAAWSAFARPIAGERRIQLPPVNGWYWTTMLLAGTLGTAIGDFTSFRSGLGLPLASALLSVLVVMLVTLGATSLLGYALYYWLTVVGVRAAGTSVGDLSAHTIGLGPSTVIMSIALALFLAVTRGSTAEPHAAAAGAPRP